MFPGRCPGLSYFAPLGLCLPVGIRLHEVMAACYRSAERKRCQEPFSGERDAETARPPTEKGS